MFLHRTCPCLGRPFLWRRRPCPPPFLVHNRFTAKATAWKMQRRIRGWTRRQPPISLEGPVARSPRMSCAIAGLQQMGLQPCSTAARGIPSARLHVAKHLQELEVVASANARMYIKSRGEKPAMSGKTGEGRSLVDQPPFCSTPPLFAVAGSSLRCASTGRAVTG